MDNVTTSMLDGLEPSQLDQLPPGVLADLHWLLAQDKLTLTRREVALHGTFERRYADKAAEERRLAGKDTGSVHVIDGEYDVVVNLPKKIEWDQEKLKAALNALDPDDAKHFAKAVFSVEERKFEAAPPALRDALSVARTVKTGKPTYALSPLKECAA
jgi:hypothetical protein